jgi:hypothetical protein
MLTGSTKMVNGQDDPFRLSGHMDRSAVGGKAGPKPSVSFERNVVSP